MKHLLSILFLVIITSNSQAQNVGIGTTTPEKPLTIKTNGMGVSQESNDGTAKVGFYTATNTAFVQTHSNTDLNLSTNNGTAQMTLQAATGNVGIGTTTPAAKLDVNGRLQTSEGANLGGNVDILGDLQTQGSIATDASLFVSDNATINGNVVVSENATINGTVKIAGGSPGVGKVLTSDAAGNANWQNSAYGNTERFQYQLVGDRINTGNINTIYKYGTSIVNYYHNEIRIKLPVSGLYHFDINVSVDYTGPIADEQTVGLYTGRIDTRTSPYLDYPLSDTYSPVLRRAGGYYPKGSVDKSFDIYANTPDEYFRFIVSHSTNQNYTQRFTITGHKIAD